MYLAGIINQDGVIDGELAARSDRIVATGRTFAYVLHRGPLDTLPGAGIIPLAPHFFASHDSHLDGFHVSEHFLELFLTLGIKGGGRDEPSTAFINAAVIFLGHQLVQIQQSTLLHIALIEDLLRHFRQFRIQRP